jgi:hypothetical protein
MNRSSAWKARTHADRKAQRKREFYILQRTLRADRARHCIGGTLAPGQTRAIPGAHNGVSMIRILAVIAAVLFPIAALAARLPFITPASTAPMRW